MITINGKKGPTYKETVRVGGRRVSKSFKRKVDAINWKRQCETDKARGQFMWLQKDSNETLEQVSREWIAAMIRPYRSRKTIYEYENTCRRHFAKFSNKPLSQISDQDARQLIAELQALGRSPKTINKVLNILKQILRFAVKQKKLRVFPLTEISEIPEPEKDFNYYDSVEIQQLLRAALGSDMHSILVLALNTGMRLGEILGLKWDKVYLDRSYLTCARIMTRHGLQEFTKTRRIRNIGINAQLEFELKKLKNHAQSDFVVVGSNNQPLNPDHFCGRRMKTLARSIGLRELRFHDLRHTYASQFMMAGGSLYDLQHILGHSKVDMTQKYAHLSHEHLIQAVNTIGFTAEDLKSQSVGAEKAPKADDSRKLMENCETLSLVRTV